MSGHANAIRRRGPHRPMQRPAVLAVLALPTLLVLAGCLAPGPGPATTPAPGPSAAPALLDCGGADNGTAALEMSYLGSCWGHIGHHIYLVDPPRAVARVNGSLFAVEAEVAGIEGEPLIRFEASLDGRAWAPLGTAPYPYAGSGLTEERHAIDFDFLADLVPARFVRVSMPPSTQEGLAGYIDHTRLFVHGRPVEAAEPAPRPTSDCLDGVLESFFPEHPCWFGGYDRVDEALGGGPAAAHLGTYPIGSYYDSPSFFHTHYLGAGVEGPFAAEARVQHWRTPNQFALCSAYGGEAPLRPVILAQASPDGRNWTEVARAEGDYDASVTLRGEAPEGTRLVRFAAAPSPGDQEHAPCHHPVAFLVESRIDVAISI